MDPRSAAETILGPIKWDSPYSGHCHCPGESLHTTRTDRRACLVRIDGVPTLYCFHAHCREAVSNANAALRARLNAEEWELILPGGRRITRGEWISPPPSRGQPKGMLGQVEAEIRARRDRIFSEHHWPYAEIFESSPIRVAEHSPEDHFRHWLLLWPADAIIWIGNVCDSGNPAAATHFRSLDDWYQIGPAMGNFTCGSSFHPCTTSRSDAAVLCREFLVVESDLLSKDEVGAVFKWMTTRLRMNLFAVVDTAGKSLHAWFGSPPPDKEPGLKAALAALSCDTKMFNRSQPVRLPGAWREGHLQKLIWIRK